MANNPAVLKGWIELSGALAKTLPRKLGEQIAIAIAEQNGCAYCLSAHTAVAGRLGIDAREIDDNRSGGSDDERVAAALGFALAVNANRGGVSDTDLAEVRAAGYDDADIAAIVAHVALNVLTNYLNRVAQPVIDFPEVTPRMAEAA
jgi:AhpD family alkylhydroperoxidase